jgi:DNA-binding transcriptional regulator YbjK
VNPLRQLVLQAPAPVIARVLGFHDVTTTRIAADAGGPWSRYAPDYDSP